MNVTYLLLTFPRYVTICTIYYTVIARYAMLCCALLLQCSLWWMWGSRPSLSTPVPLIEAAQETIIYDYCYLPQFLTQYLLLLPVHRLRRCLLGQLHRLLPCWSHHVTERHPTSPSLPHRSAAFETQVVKSVTHWSGNEWRGGRWAGTFNGRD